MLPDPWLRRWVPLIQECSRSHPVLELGCGPGEDTATLTAAGLSVVALDLSPASVAVAKLRTPQADIHCQDVRDAFPLGEADAGAVIASLSLHYFPWVDTVSLVERIRRTIRPGGVFLCRLNSTEDQNFGASGHPAIESNFYRVDGQTKRFFDRAAVDELFGHGWDCISKEHLLTRKYVRQKALWEVVVRRRDTPITVFERDG